jgi:GT2 family glycosyltransferase
VVNYNGLGHIEYCLQSLLSQTRPPDEVVVVDNASSDGSPRLVGQRFPQFRLVESGDNLGYARGCNLGIRRTRSDLVAVLNNDLVLDPGWLSALLRRVREPWSFWASRILFANSPDRVDSAGDAMAVIGSAYKIGHGEETEGYLEPREVFGPCGAAALYRRRLLEELDGFDEDFFLVYEDADLNMRARLRGHRCLYVPDAVVYHQVNRSIGRLSPTYVYYGHRNSEYLFWKNMPTSLLVRYLPERALFNLLCLAYFGGRGRGLSFLKSKLDALLGAGTTLRKRRLVQATRTISTRDLRRILDRNWLRNRRKPANRP